jgi:hypothetical protein
MRKYRKYQEYLIESLKDPEEASAYLKASLGKQLSPKGECFQLANAADLGWLTGSPT